MKRNGGNGLDERGMKRVDTGNNMYSVNTQNYHNSSSHANHNTFDDIESMLANQSKYQQRISQTQKNKIRSNFSIEDIVQKILQAGDDIQKLEVEARVGLIKGAFHSGAIVEDWGTLLKYLNTNYGGFQETKVTDFIYPDSRIIYDDINKVVLQKEAKMDKNQFDLHTNLVYDIRVSVSVEQKLPSPQSPPLDFNFKRIKHRYTFLDQDWKIDLTNVRKFEKDKTMEETFEIEVELLSETVCRCGDVGSLTTLITKFVNEVKSLISIIQPDSQLSFPDIDMDKVSPEETFKLRETVCDLIPGSNRTKELFPGSMPVNFGKKVFQHVQTHDYFVSEKTDGLRYMLLVTQNNCYLTDRKFEFYKLKNYSEVAKYYGNGTLIDGEMVRHLKTNKPCYLVFDLLAYNGELYAQKPLSTRLELIGSKIISNYRANFENQDRNPFIIVAKFFLPKNSLHKIFNIITDHKGIRTFSDQRRCHHTDGIIFTPNTPYTPYTQHDLFKWKYLDKWTIDFRLAERRNPNPNWVLTCLGNNNQEVDCRKINFSPSDIEKLQKDYKRARNIEQLIIECSFQPQSGIWKYHTTRYDKTRANYISIVMDTMESIAESISQEELQYRIGLKPENDKWDEELSKLKHTLFTKMKSGQQHSSSSSSSSSGHIKQYGSNSAHMQKNHFPSPHIPSSSSVSSHNNSNSNNSTHNTNDNDNSSSSRSSHDDSGSNSAYYQGSQFKGNPFGEDEDDVVEYNPPQQQGYIEDEDDVEEYNPPLPPSGSEFD